MRANVGDRDPAALWLGFNSYITSVSQRLPVINEFWVFPPPPLNHNTSQMFLSIPSLKPGVLSTERLVTEEVKEVSLPRELIPRPPCRLLLISVALRMEPPWGYLGGLEDAAAPWAPGELVTGQLDSDPGGSVPRSQSSASSGRACTPSRGQPHTAESESKVGWKPQGNRRLGRCRTPSPASHRPPSSRLVLGNRFTLLRLAFLLCKMGIKLDLPGGGACSCKAPGTPPDPRRRSVTIN